jgi:hypothetical protein
MRHGNGSSGLLKIVHSLTVFTAVLSPAILSGSPSAWAQCDHELRTYHTNGATRPAGLDQQHGQLRRRHRPVTRGGRKLELGRWRSCS